MPNAREVVLDSCGPEQRLLMAMLAAPSSGSIWGEGRALADAVSWEQFLNISDELLRPYLHWVCQKDPFATVIPSSVKQALAAARFAAGVRNLRWKTELRQILKAFARKGVRSMLVKGAALQRTIYPDPSTRLMGDVDLVVHPDGMANAHEILIQLGYRPRTPVDGFTPWIGLRADEEEYFYKNVEGQILLVEIHTRLELTIPEYSGSAEPIWAHCIEPRSTDGIVFSTLEPHIALRHLCLHLAKHGFERGLRWLLDIRLFVDHCMTPARWEQFIRDRDQLSSPMIAFTLGLAKEWLGARVPSAVLAGLTRETKGSAVSLVWAQIWDYERVRKPPNVLTVWLTANPRRIWANLRMRVQRWTSPIPTRNVNPLVLAGKRFVSDFRILAAAFRAGGLKPSSLRTARRIDNRTNRLRALLWPP